MVMDSAVISKQDGRKITISLIVNSKQGADGSLGLDDVVVSPLMFDIEDIAKLRTLGICGILSGTLPSATQQNLFLSVPLKLMVEEAIWLYVNGFAKFKLLRGPTTKIITDLLNEKGDEINKVAELRLEKSFELQRKYKREQHLLKLERLGISKPGNDEKTQLDETTNRLMENSLFLEIDNVSTLLHNTHSRMEISDIAIENAMKCLISQYSNWNNYLLFQSLKDKSYVISPGARFGGKFIAYPGDPLRYHSHMVIQDALDYHNDPIDLLSITSGARLGTTVKKLWVIGGVKSNEKEKKDIKDLAKVTDDSVSIYSIEWSGFG